MARAQTDRDPYLVSQAEQDGQTLRVVDVAAVASRWVLMLVLAVPVVQQICVGEMNGGEWVWVGPVGGEAEAGVRAELC